MLLQSTVMLIRAEFAELPALCVTVREAARRWDLDDEDAQIVLDTFVQHRLLERSRAGTYSKPAATRATGARPLRLRG